METGTYRAVHRGVRNMRIRYILKLMLDDIFQKKIMIILLLAMSSISIYMTDVIATRYFSNQYRINSMSSMFAVNPDKVNYVKYLNLMSPEYTPQIGDELIQYIRNYQGVVACGRFNNNKMILNGELVKTLVIEKDIANMGNLLLDNDNLKSKKMVVRIWHMWAIVIGMSIKQEFNLIIMRKMRNQVARLQVI